MSNERKSTRIVSAVVPAKMADKIDRLTLYTGQSKSEVIREAIEMKARDIDKMGIL